MFDIFVFGNFGYVNSQLDGQTVKTRSLYSIAKDKVCSVDYYDTQTFSISKKSLINAFWKVCHSQTLFFVPAQNNLIYIFPIIYILSKLFGFKVQYFVVGGWLDVFLRNKNVYSAMLRSIDGIYCETNELKSQIETLYHFENVHIFPNFRLSPTRVFSERNNDGITKIVFYARIMMGKGIDVVFSLADYIQNKKITDIIIDFYGQVISDDSEYFYENIAKYPFVNYKGEISPEKVYEILPQYDFLLFPTHFLTEGLPGSIVDSYLSGIPVIASNWKYSREFIDDKKTGIVVPFDNNINDIVDAVFLLRQDKHLLSLMKKWAFDKGYNFSYEKASLLFDQYFL